MLNYQRTERSQKFFEGALMNKGEFIKIMSDKAGSTQKDAALYYEAFVATIEDGLTAGEKIQLLGFGNFEVKEVAGRTGVNPQTGAKVSIPASKKPVFKFGANFKSLINKGNKK